MTIRLWEKPTIVKTKEELAQQLMFVYDHDHILPDIIWGSGMGEIHYQDRSIYWQKVDGGYLMDEEVEVYE